MTLPADVSRETRERLEIYERLVKKWQRAVNLVSPATLDFIWDRHIVDSAQLLPFIPHAAATLTDWGSGAGFPGLVLAIMKPSLSVTLVESDSKKCSFLAAVSRETGIKATILNERIERANRGPSPDVLTARALAPLAGLLELSTPYAQMNPALIQIFPKGASWREEKEEALERFDFQCEDYPSATDSRARILKIHGFVTPKAGRA